MTKGGLVVVGGRGMWTSVSLRSARIGFKATRRKPV